WPALAPWVEKLRGADVARQYLRDLALSTHWSADATPSDVVGLLHTIALLGHRDLVHELALEGSRHHATIPITAGFVEWLEAHPSDDGLKAVDAYYERLRD